MIGRTLLGILLFCAPQEERARIVFVGVWDRSAPLIESASRETGVKAGLYRATDLVKGTANLDGVEIVFVLNLDSAEVTDLKRRFEEALKANPKLRIVPLDSRPVHAEFRKAGWLTDDPEVPKYWRPNGLTNMRRLLAYTSITYLGGKGTIEAPVVVPDFGYYDPEREEPFSDFESYRAWKAGHRRWKEGAPTAALLIQQSFWITHDTKVIDAELRALEARGVNVAVLFGDTQERVAGMLHETRPDLLIEDRHGSMWGDGALLEEIDVPYLRPISMLGYTVDDWLKDPRGLSYRDTGMFMSLQESRGTIEPIIVGGLKASIQGFRLHEPVPERVERFADRAVNRLRLRSKPNGEKRIAILYYNKGLGKDDFMRGSPTGAFLDGPASLARFLPRLKERGYGVDPIPKSGEQLIEWIRARARNIAPWAQGELEELVNSGDPITIPLSKYLKWFNEKLNEPNRKAVIASFGEPPGRIMVVERNGEKFIVVPRIQLGNVLLAPQPERGEKQDEKLLHSRDVPPPHAYLAFYWWLEEEYKADAIVHWGTHGTLELLPGKETGLTKDCWSDICVGTVPVVNLWIMDNLGEASLSRRRSYALLVDHMVPPSVTAGLADDLSRLHDDIDKFEGLEPGLLREEFRKNITAATKHTGIDRIVKADVSTRALTDDEIRHVAEHLHEIHNMTTPQTLHVLGQPPPEKLMIPYLVSILRRTFLDHVERIMPVPKEEDRFPGDKYKWLRARAEELLKGILVDGRPCPAELEKDVQFAREMLAKLKRADEEIAGLLRALEGRYIRPGPGPDPIRNPASIPAGRNLYMLNPEEIPTRASWEVAVKLVDEMLKTRRPRKVGLDLNGMETMRDFGVMEAQILYLMGVRPVWDANNLAVNVALIPRAELKRPRIDVFVAMGGMYKENFPSRVELLDKAVRLAAATDEEENGVREGTLKLEQQLLARGFSDERAKLFSSARIFGTKPGNMSGTNILYLVPRSGVWDKDAEVADVYIDNMSFVYTKGVWGEKVEGLYGESIQGTDTLVRVWASNMTSQLSNHHAYEYLGGLSMAVKKLTGREPEALIADVRDADGARMREFEKVLETTMRAEILNRAWIEGMKGHGYAGGAHMSEIVKNTFGWDVTRSGSVSDATWNEIFAVYVQDKYGLGLPEFFEKNNPHALEEIAATMLEAARKGYWKASPEAVRTLSEVYADVVRKHGPSNGLVSGGNTKLEEMVRSRLTAPGDAAGAKLAGDMTEAISKASGVPSSRRILGQQLEMTPEKENCAPPSGRRIAPVLIATLAALLVLYGFARRKGAA